LAGCEITGEGSLFLTVVASREIGRVSRDGLTGWRDCPRGFCGVSTTGLLGRPVVEGWLSLTVDSRVVGRLSRVGLADGRCCLIVSEEVVCVRLFCGDPETEPEP